MALIDLCSLLLKMRPNGLSLRPDNRVRGPRKEPERQGVHISLEPLLSSLTGVIFVLVTLVVPPLGDRVGFDQARPRLTNFSFS